MSLAPPPSVIEAATLSSARTAAGRSGHVVADREKVRRRRLRQRGDRHAPFSLPASSAGCCVTLEVALPAMAAFCRRRSPPLPWRCHPRKFTEAGHAALLAGAVGTLYHMGAALSDGLSGSVRAFSN
jgi:hypothetical protein